MFFFFRKPKIVVDCFTPYKSVYDLYKIRPAMQFFPEEISKIKSYQEVTNTQLGITTKSSTVKRCVGLRELYSSGFVIPMWTDIIVNPLGFTNKQSALASITSPFVYGKHPDYQLPSGLYEEYHFSKFDSPWHLKEKLGIKFSWISPTWNLSKFSKNVIIPPGVISFDIQSGTNLNILFYKKCEQFIIEAGTPIAQLIPQSEKTIELKYHLVGEQEWMNVGMPPEFNSILPNRYMRYKKLMNDTPKKCPFGFGK